MTTKLVWKYLLSFELFKVRQPIKQKFEFIDSLTFHLRDVELGGDHNKGFFNYSTVPRTLCDSFEVRQTRCQMISSTE